MLKFKYRILKFVLLILWTLEVEAYGEHRYRVLSQSGCSTMFELYKKKREKETKTEEETECIERIGFR